MVRGDGVPRLAHPAAVRRRAEERFGQAVVAEARDRSARPMSASDPGDSAACAHVGRLAELLEQQAGVLVVGEQGEDGAVRVADVGLAELVGQGRRSEQVPALVRGRGRELRPRGPARSRRPRRRRARRRGRRPARARREGLVVAGRGPGPVQDSPVGARADRSRQRQVPGLPGCSATPGYRRPIASARGEIAAALRQLDQAGDMAGSRTSRLRRCPAAPSGVEQLPAATLSRAAPAG